MSRRSSADGPPRARDDVATTEINSLRERCSRARGSWRPRDAPQLPRHVYNAYRQAQIAVAIGDRRAPAAVLVSDDPTEPVLFVAALADVKSFCEALSEMGQASKVRSLVRSARRVLDQIEGCAR